MSRRKRDSEMGVVREMAGDTTSSRADRERVAARAYELYLARGAADGQADEDWFTAERELGNNGRSTRES
jgi:hypothetical protein